ncbi:UBN2_3 domain-containing protein [Cephalotus follicularis]|uniref:UBN2_3 domain-containing protein n=1 Tax=Cephalotus follicularis TaxID=3775 RepID=A0A1Q3CAG5_CEPFO|nr:UBN2_3 domain-containing protein [Cephalotus follicularis]
MAKKKLKFLTSYPSTPDASGYEDWMQENGVILIWLWNSMEPEIAENVMFHNTAKGVWDDLKDTYSQDKNMNRVYDLYDKMFHLHQSGKPLHDYYSTFKGLAEELNVFQPLTNDIDKLKAHRNEFLVSKFLAGLDPDLQKLKGHILAGETVPSLTDTFSQLQRVAYPMQHESSPKDNSAFTIGRGRG